MPHSQSLCFECKPFIGYANRKITDTLLYLAERDRRLRRFGLLYWVDVLDNLLVLLDETP